jgi:hypothetical protein
MGLVAGVAAMLAASLDRLKLQAPGRGSGKDASGYGQRKGWREPLSGQSRNRTRADIIGARYCAD